MVFRGFLARCSMRCQTPVSGHCQGNAATADPRLPLERLRGKIADDGIKEPALLRSCYSISFKVPQQSRGLPANSNKVKR